MGGPTMRMLAAFAIAGWCAASALVHASEGFAVTILHTNDLHSRYEFIDVDGMDCRPADAADSSCFISVSRLATAVKEARERNPNTILLDAGDQFPVPRYPVPPEIGRPLAADLMNRMGYDAMTIGNHEFDDGSEVLAGFVSSLAFPALSTDESRLSDPLLEGMVKPTAVLEVQGERIGIIGLGAASLRGPGPEALAQEYADQFMARDIDKIIAISHFGYKRDKVIAEKTTGIDVIVGGHSHSRLSNSPIGKKLGMTYPTMVNGVAIVQAYQFGAFLGELHVTFDELGNIVSATGDPIPMDSVEDDLEIRALVEAAVAKIAAIED